MSVEDTVLLSYLSCSNVYYYSFLLNLWFFRYNIIESRHECLFSDFITFPSNIQIPILNFLFLILLCLPYRPFPRWWLMSSLFMLRLHNLPQIQKSKAQTSSLQECRNSLLLLTLGTDFPRSTRQTLKRKGRELLIANHLNPETNYLL